MKTPLPLLREYPFQEKIPPRREDWVWTVSSLKLFRNCKRKFYWKYILGLKPRKLSSSLYIGSFVHRILADWYTLKNTSMENILDEHLPKIEKDIEGKIWDQDELDKIVIALETLNGIFRAYEQVYKQDRKKLQIVHVEKKLEFIENNFSLAGKIDLIVKSNKFFNVWDHKTSSFIDSSYLNRLPLDTQLRGYAYLAYKNKMPVNEVTYNCIKKCALRRKSGESREDFCDRIAKDYIKRSRIYFHREKVVISMEDLRSFEYELLQTNDEFLRIFESGGVLEPRNWGINCSHCSAFFRDCEYLTLCTQGVDKTAKLMYEEAELHEELENE